MSRVLKVIQNKNKLERTHRARRREELTRLRDNTAYGASLYEYFKLIDNLLRIPDINGVKIKVPEKHLAKFNVAIYSEKMAAYDIEQMGDKPDEFIIRQKMI